MPTQGRSDATSEQRLATVFLTHGVIGIALTVAITLVRAHEVAATFRALGATAIPLLVIFTVYAVALGLLRFALTDHISVSLQVVAYISMFPLFGPVLSAWVAVISAVATRLLGQRHIGPVKVDMTNRRTEIARTFALFGTYGVPVIAAAYLYEIFGGAFPINHVSPANTARIAVASVVLILLNNLIMARVEHALGYSIRESTNLAVIDVSIYLLALPYAICTTFSFVSLGWSSVLVFAFTGILANLLGQRLARIRAESDQQFQRLASLTNVGQLLSLDVPTGQLLTRIYRECKKVIDVSIFSIALYDEKRHELSFELEVRDEKILPKLRIPLGEGLNSWVVENGLPLRLVSQSEEASLGMSALRDEESTESWLGVPMVARDRVIGVISVQSYRRGVFTADDQLILTAITNQAAVSLDNAKLYRELEVLTIELEQRVLERTRDLREANLRLSAADRSKNQFLANMSHELRTPLNSIIGFSSILLDSAKDALPPHFLHFLSNIHVAGKHLLELINEILDLSKVEAGRMKLQAEEFDIRRCIAEVVEQLKDSAAGLRSEIRTSVDSDVPALHLDPTRVTQIIRNLLQNALKFTTNGSPVELRVWSIERAVSPLRQDSIGIEVRDRGIGIASDEIGQIFDEFYQTDQGRKSRFGGPGLGLSLVRNFVELHSGVVTVESRLGEGSVFQVILPVRLSDSLPGDTPAVAYQS